jgi:hypothetical protein
MKFGHGVFLHCIVIILFLDYYTLSELFTPFFYSILSWSHYGNIMPVKFHLQNNSTDSGKLGIRVYIHSCEVHLISVPTGPIKN